MNDISKQYVQLSEREHVLQRSGIYLGSIVPTTKTLYQLHKDKFKQTETTFCPALIKLFDEIISNSVDEHIRTKGKSVKTIKVTLNTFEGEITVEDDGGIPVIKHSEYKKWIPELIFGEMRTGSNFSDTERVTAGLNGMGSTLVSIFSTYFRIETCDGKQKFIQTYKDNLNVKSNPTIIDSNENFTKVTFIPDYNRLGCLLDNDNISQITKRCYDVAGCNPKIKVYLNGNLIKLNGFNQYFNMYCENAIYDKTDNWEICLGSVEDDTFKHLSFVNGIDTYEGGTHVDYITNQITSMVRDYVKTKHKIDIKPNNIKQQLFIGIKSIINAPIFNSQTKETMVADVKNFGSEYIISPVFTKKILSSDVIQKVLDWAEGEQRKKELAELKKLNKQASKNNAIKRISKFDECSSKDRSECILLLTEGDSAATPMLSARNPKTMAIFPLKGKPLNVRDIPIKKIIANEEFANIMTITGLKIGEDSTDLRFGKIVIASDADADGLHIRGLIINMFNEFWPKILENGNLYFLNTPIIIAYGKHKNTKPIEFFSISEYNNWVLTNKQQKYTIKYQKGLGGWSSKDMSRFLTESKYLVQFIYDNKSKHHIDIAFDKKLANTRKEWLMEV